MKGFFYEVREFFASLFERSKPRYIGFLRMPSVENGKPSKQAKCQIGFKK